MKRIAVTLALLAAIAVAGAAALKPLADRYGLYLGTYYTRVDAGAMERVDADDGMDYRYDLPACDADGARIEVGFSASRELRDGAWLKLEVQPLRGVVSWEEARPDAVPAAAARALG